MSDPGRSNTRYQVSRSREETRGLFCSHQAEWEGGLFRDPCLVKSGCTWKYIYNGGLRWPSNCYQAPKAKMQTLQVLLLRKRCLGAYEPCSWLSLRLLPLPLPLGPIHLPLTQAPCTRQPCFDRLPGMKGLLCTYWAKFASPCLVFSKLP